MNKRSRHNGANQKLQTHFAFAFITVLFSLVFSFLIAEIAVRAIFPFNTPDTIREHSIQYVPAVFAQHLLRPVDRLIELDSGKAWGTKSAEEPSSRRIFISANGYRGRSFSVRKPARLTRIIIVGGSAVFDQNVSDSDSDTESSWPNLVEKRLRDGGLENIEVINSGVPGHSSADSLGRLYSQLWMYKPDIILVYHGWNDIKFWKRSELSPERPLISQVRPYDPTSNPFTSYQGSWDNLLSHSQLYVKLRNRVFQWQTDVGAEGVIQKNKSRSDSYERFGPEQFRLNMELIVSACKILGITPILITQGTLATPENTSEDLARIDYDYQHLTHKAIVGAFLQTYDIIRDIGARTDTQVIDVASKVNGHSNLFADHVHTTPAGSRELARLVADALHETLSETTELPGQ